MIAYLENSISPLKRQLKWDNSGKQIYFGNEKICKIALALDPTAEAIKDATSEGCGLLITHHPLFFDSLSSMDFSNKGSQKILDAITNKLSIVSYHTNFDVANYNLSDHITSLIGAKKEGPLESTGSEKLYKFVVYIPAGYEDKIIDVIDKSGAGTIGNYRKCAFLAKGTGTFEPQEDTQPFIGTKGKFEKVNEYKLETIVREENIKSLINNVLEIHPYEEVAYDVYKLENEMVYGVGTKCYYEEPIYFDAFCKILKVTLNVKIMRMNKNMNNNEKVSKFCVVAGSGASYWHECKEQGYKILVSGDLKHHDAIDARENDITIIDVGHFELEKIYLQYIAERLKEKFNIDIILINESSPINYLEV